MYGSSTVTTPPLSLASSPAIAGQERERQSIVGILEQSTVEESRSAAKVVGEASEAAVTLRHGLPVPSNSVNGVRIWSGPSADKAETTEKMMPSISESALEQDFTIEGVPSKLGCPFASMANKKLSSHAASVLGRYNQGSTGGAPSTPLSSVSRINGKERFSRRRESRPSLADPIKAEICGLSDHDAESPYSERAIKEQHEKHENVDVGVCPIRFLDQHSPEEVATYFENHKHELPRSHENCVKRYQSNEQQIRELDAKYGTLVSMIQGLGAKHKELLPKEPDDGVFNVDDDTKSDDKVRKWASSVSAQAGEAEPALENGEDRQPHFERPLRDIRVGESPSRPWGISVPSKYMERRRSETSSKPVEPMQPPAIAPDEATMPKQDTAKPTQCPFGYSKNAAPQQQNAAPVQADQQQAPIFVSDDVDKVLPNEARDTAQEPGGKSSQMVFSGPVFIGYSANDAVKILQRAGLAVS